MHGKLENRTATSSLSFFWVLLWMPNHSADTKKKEAQEKRELKAHDKNKIITIKYSILAVKENHAHATRLLKQAEQ